MRLMLVYVLLVIVGEIAAVELSLYLVWSSDFQPPPIALALFFSVPGRGGALWCSSPSTG